MSSNYGKKTSVNLKNKYILKAFWVAEYDKKYLAMSHDSEV